MNSQSWLPTYLTQNSLRILLLKCLQSLESCLSRQWSQFLSVGHCPLWATPWNVRVWSLQDAPAGSWGHKWTETGQQLDSWSVEIAHPGPKPVFSKGPAGAEARHSHPSHPSPFPSTTAQTHPGHPRAPTHPSGSHLAALDLSDRIFGTGSMFYCHKRWLKSRLPSPPHPITCSSINWSILWQISYFLNMFTCWKNCDQSACSNRDIMLLPSPCTSDRQKSACGC